MDGYKKKQYIPDLIFLTLTSTMKGSHLKPEKS